MEYSVIIPVCNEEESLQACYQAVSKVMQMTGQSYELIFVDDASSDQSFAMLTCFAEQDTHVKVVRLSRNFGHQAAITCGMNKSSGQAVMMLDADLQDPPEILLQMIAKWKQGYHVVYGKRVKRKGEGLFKKLTAYCYYRVIQLLSDTPINLDAADFRLLDRKVVEIINNMQEHNRYVRGMNSWVGFRQAAVEYVREPRFSGSTKYSTKKMLKLAADGIISNSKKPLKLALHLGIILTLLSIAAFVVLGIFHILQAMGHMVFVVELGYYIVTAIALSTGLILSNLGITNAYVGRMYDEVKNRPLYIIEETKNFLE